MDQTKEDIFYWGESVLRNWAIRDWDVNTATYLGIIKRRLICPTAKEKFGKRLLKKNSEMEMYGHPMAGLLLRLATHITPLHVWRSYSDCKWYGILGNILGNIIY